MQEIIMTAEQLENVIKKYKSIVIYGAGIVAYNTYKTLKEVYKIESIDFVVSDVVAKCMIGFCDVKEISAINEKDANKLFLVATPEIYHNEIRIELECRKIENVIYVTDHIEFLLMSQYYKEKTRFRILKNEIPKEYACGKIFDEKNVLVCMCQSMYDTALKTKVEREWFVKIMHVGNANETVKSSELVDCIGDNISEKNRMYCELTATYWLWKNADNRYKGIYHYRRQLDIAKNEMQWCMDSDIDAILPLPYMAYPNMKGQYGRYIDDEDEEILLQSMRECVPGEMNELKKILEGEYIYNYNMLIAKQEVFDAYCEWMFPILFRAEEIREKTRPDGKARFAGYFGEVLTSLFFLKNKERYNIVHARREWYV